MSRADVPASIAHAILRCRARAELHRQVEKLDKVLDWLEFQLTVAVLSHAMLLIASLFASPIGVGHAQPDACACQSQTHDRSATHEVVWVPANAEVRVHGYASLRARDVSSVRVLGRCVVKNAPEDAQPVLYVPFGSPLDNPDDQDLADTRTETRAQFGQPEARGVGPADLHALHALVIQLDRPPRV